MTQYNRLKPHRVQLSSRPAVIRNTIAKAIGDMVAIRKNWLIELADEFETYEKIYDAVKEIHKPFPMNPDLDYCDECVQKYPCITIKTIEDIKNDI